MDQDRVADPLDAGRKFLRDAQQNIEKELRFLRCGQIELHQEQIGDDGTAIGGNADDKGICQNDRKGLCVKADFLIPRMAGEEEERLSMPFNAGHFILIEAVSEICYV